MMIKNSTEHGNAVFHIALKPDGTLQPIINVPLLWSNKEMIKKLLNTTALGIHDVESPTGEKYMFVFDGTTQRPYPSVMIFKFRSEGNDSLLIDVAQDDFPAIEFAVDNYLK